jgi:5-oxoprolinase (ATP-hydrolysing) subunit A
MRAGADGTARLERAAMGDSAVRWRRDPARDPRALLDLLRAHAGVIDAVVTEEHAMVTFDPARPPEAPWLLEDRAPLAGSATHPCEHVVRLLGFLPGFAYLGPVAPSLVLARRATPRPRVEAGAIGIAGGYTGVYPFASPGGWHLVAHAVDFAPFDLARGARLGLGDRVRFEVAP